jgi:hypothetical protein
VDDGPPNIDYQTPTAARPKVTGGWVLFETLFWFLLLGTIAFWAVILLMLFWPG